MQNNQKIIAIFGAGGFLGRHLMRKLTELDYRIKSSHTKSLPQRIPKTNGKSWTN